MHQVLRVNCVSFYETMRSCTVRQKLSMASSRRRRICMSPLFTNRPLMLYRSVGGFIFIWLMLDTPGADCMFEYLRQYLNDKIGGTFGTTNSLQLKYPTSRSATPVIDSVVAPSFTLLELLSQHHLQNNAAAHIYSGENSTIVNRSTPAIMRSFSLMSSSPTMTCCAVYRRCFDLIGDFFHILRRPINLSPDCHVDVSFILNTRNAPHGSDFTFRLAGGGALQENVAALLSQSDFDPRRSSTVFIIHGFISLADWTYFRELKNALLARSDVNVFRVNWEKAAVMPYTQATANARVVGAAIGQFIEFLVRNFALAPQRIHLVGHSLGAHIAGYAAQELAETSRNLMLLTPPTLLGLPDNPTSTLRDLLARILITKQRIGRITALDAASPYFSNLPFNVRLDRGDADFVEVLHTDTANLGIAEPFGHVDYFPNGGAEQPGCSDSFLNAAWTTITNMSMTAGREQLSCSHVRAILLYSDLIRSSSSLTSDANYHRRPILTERGANIRSGSGGNKNRIVTADQHTAAGGAIRATRYGRRRRSETHVASFKHHYSQPTIDAATYRPANDWTPATTGTCQFVAFKCDSYKNFLAAKCVDCSSEPDRCRRPADTTTTSIHRYDATPNNVLPLAEEDGGASSSKYFLLTSSTPSASSMAQGSSSSTCVHHIVVAIELARRDEAGRLRPLEHAAIVHVRLHFAQGTMSPAVSEEIALTSASDDDTTFRVGRVRTFLIGSRAPLKAIAAVSVRWTNVRSSLNPVRLTYALFGYLDPDVMLIKNVALLSAVAPTDHGRVAASAVRARLASNILGRSRSSSGTASPRLIVVRENAEALVPMIGWYSVD